MRRAAILTTMLMTSLTALAPMAAAGGSLGDAIAGDHRTEDNKARDVYRNPKATLEFFEVEPDMTVIEIWPGTGWYSEILAPYLKDDGTFIAAQFGANPPFGYQRRAYGKFLTKLGETPKLYRDVKITEFSYPYALSLGPKNSADRVLTFRNAHNWVSDLYPDGHFAPLAFQASFDVLKPGGILGVVDHRWDDPENEDPLSGNGYMSEARVIALAEAAGFELAGRSDINANPKDSKDHEKGVWTLPPVLAMGDTDRDAYLSIGESDRMTLKFKKPE